MIILLVFVLILLLVIYQFGIKNMHYWKNKKVAHKKLVPFLGSYTTVVLQKEALFVALKKVYDEFPNEKYVGTFLGNNPTLLLKDPDMIKQILVKDFYYFNSRGTNVDWKNEPLERNLAAVWGDDWRVLRQNLTPLFSSAKMRNMCQLVMESGKEFEQMVSKRIEQCDSMDMKDLMSRFTLDVIGTCAFGLQMNSISEDETLFRKMADTILEVNAAKGLKLWLRSVSPSVFSFLKLNVFDRQLETFFVDLVRKVIQMREENPEDRKDFVEFLARFKTQGYITGESIENLKDGGSRNIEIPINDELLAAQSFVFFLAGHETSATTMAFALYELAKNKEIQTRLQTEISKLLGKNDNKITYELLQEATYLDMVISETLRKYPVTGILDRMCTSKYTFPGTGFTVDPGVKVHVPVFAIHYDPKYYPQPDLFDPERFAADAKKDRNPYTYMPFGEGQRICIGMRFAKMQMLIGLISLLKDHSVEPCAKTAATIEFVPATFIMMAKDGIWLKITPRKKNE